MDPFNALPSSRVYRGSLLALLVGTVFAVWLLVRPGGSDAGTPPAGLIGVVPTTTTETAVTATVEPGGTQAPPPAATTPPPASPTPPPPTATLAPRTHTVASGETLTIIANNFRGNVPVNEYLQQIYQLNNLGPNSILSVGQVITLP
jgi:LysM repeat protein